MPDIELRFGRDMLVLSAPVDAMLARQGIDVARDRQYLNLMEPDAIADALRLEVLAGAQCLVTTTEDITRTRLSHVRMEGDAARLARSAIAIVSGLKPQHVIVEIGPCGLPLDASSKASLNENRAQYADAARAFEDCTFDAFFLNGFASLVDLKCALMGVSQASGKPVMASVTLGSIQAQPTGADQEASRKPPAKSNRPADQTLFALGYEPIDGPIAPAVPVPSARLDASQWEEAIAVMQDLGASVVGFETADPLSKALEYARAAARLTTLPIMAQLCVGAEPDRRASALVPVESREDYSLDTMEYAAQKLRGEGVQFLRATGSATPAYTGALAAAVSGLDVPARDR